LIIAFTSARASSSLETAAGQSNVRFFLVRLMSFVKLVVELTDSRFRLFRLGHFGDPFAFA
jgi:hypothetical protein